MIVNKRILKKKVSILRKGEGVYGTISRLIRVPSAIMVSSDTHLPGQIDFPLSPWRVPQCPSDAGNEIVMIRPPSVKCIPSLRAPACWGHLSSSHRNTHTSAPGQICSYSSSQKWKNLSLIRFCLWIKHRNDRWPNNSYSIKTVSRFKCCRKWFFK